MTIVRGSPQRWSPDGGVSDTLTPPHHTGGLYFAWLRPQFFSRPSGAGFPLIFEAFYNGVWVVLEAKGAYNTTPICPIILRWTRGTLSIVVNESFTILVILW